MSEASKRLDRITQSALQRIETTMGDRQVAAVETLVVLRTGIWAEVGLNDRTLFIHVSSGTIEAIDALAAKLVRSPLLKRDNGHRDSRFVDEAELQHLLSDTAMEWLVLHELMHWQLGHLQIEGRATLVEIEAPVPHTELGMRYSSLNGALTSAELLRVRPCLELQADNDASDVLFGEFAQADWVDIRLRAAAAFMVMMLIERENERIEAKGLTHPAAATRFFQISAQLAQFWMYADATLERHEGESRVRTGRQQQDGLSERYLRDVFAPVVTDALVIAAAAGSGAVVAEMIEGRALLLDIEAAQYAPDLDPVRFATSGAREWAELLPINEQIMAVTGLRRWSEPAA